MRGSTWLNVPAPSTIASHLLTVEGWCKRHYARWQRHGDPLGGGPDKPRADSSDIAFWSRVDKRGPRGCWQWVGRIMWKGYGQFGPRRAHRVAYELLVGPIPDGLVLDHTCRNRACVNPAHLEPVTHAENTRRGTSFAVVNAAKTECIRGHDLTDPDNVRVADGRRHCRACRLIRRRAAGSGI